MPHRWQLFAMVLVVINCASWTPGGKSLILCLWEEQ